MSLSPGQAFGNYRILQRIGVGGMGMVFLAEHPHIGKRVALKIIHRDLAGNREVVNRFLNEARAVNHIGSEHIVQIHDFGQTEDGEHFFIMEYLDGRTMAEELSGGPMEPPRALHVAAQIASALIAAHDAGIIHRDLKPDNVMLIHRLGDPDFVKLLDFGLAKFLSEADARKLTAAGVVLGTPHYMSPEACESKPNVDHRCDVYSLGVLLFQMVTGSLPFTGESMGEVLVKQVVQPPPAPRGINPKIPPAVEQVVLRCLAKEPKSRFQSMRELRDALLDPAGYLASSPPVVPVAAAPGARTMFADPGSHDSRRSPGSSPRAQRAAAATALATAADRPTALALDASHTWAAPGAPPPSTTPAGAPTAYMDDAAHRKFAGPMEHRPAQSAGPMEHRPAQSAGPMEHRPAQSAGPMEHRPAQSAGPREHQAARSGGPPAGKGRPQPVENRTMAIGMPDGYSDRPPRRMWPLVIAIMAAGAAAGVIAFFIARPDRPERQAQPAPRRGGPTVASGSGAGADAGPRRARIRLTTRPSGAEVFDAAGKLIGTTPTDLSLAVDGREVVLRFHHVDAADSEKRFTPTGDTAFDIELPPPASAAGAEPDQPDEGEADAGAEAEKDSPPEARKAPRRPEKRRPRRRKKPTTDLLRPEL